MPVCNPDGTYSEVMKDTTQLCIKREGGCPTPPAPHLTTVDSPSTFLCGCDVVLLSVCCAAHRFSVTATRDTAGASRPTADPSAAQRSPTKSPGAKVGATWDMSGQQNIHGMRGDAESSHHACGLSNRVKLWG